MHVSTSWYHWLGSAHRYSWTSSGKLHVFYAFDYKFHEDAPYLKIDVVLHLQPMVGRLGRHLGPGYGVSSGTSWSENEKNSVKGPELDLTLKKHGALAII